MKEHWFRWHHGTVADPKWRVIAARASHTMSRRVTISDVLSVWACMLECASQSAPRGNLAGWCDEDVAVGLDLDEEVVAAIRAAMQGKTLDGNALMAWEKRQPKREREDPGAAERKRAQRLRDAEKDWRDKDESRHVPPRGEERREEKEALHSVGEGDEKTSRARPVDPPDPPPPEETEETPPARNAEEQATRAGLIGRALVAAGIPVARINRYRPEFVAIVDSDVPPAEVEATARELVDRGKADVAYILRTVIGRRRDAAAAGAVAVPAKPAAPRPGGSPAVAATPQTRYAEAVAYANQMFELGRFDQAERDRQVAEAEARLARAGPATSRPPPRQSSPPAETRGTP